ncbi:MAG TPA: class I SAM-dependent methyltransferase [Thermomicrobiales bacterium]
MDPSFYQEYFRHETEHWWFRWRFDLITDVVASLRPGPSFRMLDAGCGTGQMLKCLERLGDAVGIDSSPLAIRYAKARGVKHLVHGSITAMPFPPGTFDCVLALDVIEHVEDDFGILMRLHEVTKPGGHLIVTVPAFQALWSEHDIINQHKRRYRAPVLRRLIEEAGFAIERITYCNTALTLPVFVTRKTKNLLRTVKKIRHAESNGLESDLTDYPRPINNALYWMLKGETRLMRRLNFPFGVSILAIARRPADAEGERASVTTASSPASFASSGAPMRGQAAQHG